MPYYDILTETEMFEAQNLARRYDPAKHTGYRSREAFERSILVSMAQLKSENTRGVSVS